MAAQAGLLRLTTRKNYALYSLALARIICKLFSVEIVHFYKNEFAVITREWLRLAITQSPRDVSPFAPSLSAFVPGLILQSVPTVRQVLAVNGTKKRLEKERKNVRQKSLYEKYSQPPHAEMSRWSGSQRHQMARQRLARKALHQ